ncbi:Ig-like domain-containing protein [Rufibacter sp. LB8]|uniref:Ig-like domain-containing protein n=1 Tax=Rufibacter sp. LB8 TaxID=2777781 RepID=UPI00178C7F59|nr:Ig-like domain-containing protein [Rufibacter sp. LB8]
MTRKAIFLIVLGIFLVTFAPRAFAQTLVWEENFEGTAINSNHWTFEIGDGCNKGLCSWGNNELQYYTDRPENARVEEGNLIIEARREGFQTRSFTSARLKTEGKIHFKYGTVEARIKVPDLQNGLWPALWTLGTVGGVWPSNGEIDIMEMGIREAVAAGLTNKRVGAAVHWEHNGTTADFGKHRDSDVNLNNDYHIYKMVWTSQSIKIFIDNVEYFTFNIAGAAGSDLEEFHNRHFLIMNLAVGGNYTGISNGANITAPMPAKMYVDYIKLYQNQGDELYKASEHVIAAGNFGVYTETKPTIARLDYNGGANLFIWNNLTPTTPAPAAFEGTEAIAFRASNSDWFGFGTDHAAKNLSAYKAAGSLKFHMKTSSTQTFKVGVKNGTTESWVNFVSGGQNYGLVRDGNWHEVTIPLSQFNAPSVDFSNIVSTFMLAGDKPAANFDFQLDNIYYTTGSSFKSAPLVTMTAPANGAVYTAPATIVLTATASDTDGNVTKVEFYNGPTLLGTATSIPYTFTWANAPAGMYAVTAKAFDNEGNTTTTAPVNVIVNASAVTGNFGVFTENTPTTQRLNYEGDANLFLWENTLSAITAPAPVPQEGTEVMAFKVGTVGWYGFGIAHTAKNLTGYTSGHLKFHMKTTTGGTFKVGIVSGGVESWVNIGTTGEQYGMVRDGNWHQVSIPLSAFNAANFNLASVTTSFMVASVTAPTIGAELFFDNIYYTNGVANGSSPTVSITSPVTGATFTAPASITISANAADTDGTISKVEFYRGTTLLGTATTAPYSYTWTNAPAGNYNLTAVAYDNANLTTTSTPVSVIVNGSSNSGSNYGIFTENTPVVDKLNFDGDANLFLWENTLSAVANATAFEGAEVIALKVGTVGWYGFGIANGAKNLSAYAANGMLNFHMKTTAGGTFKVGMKSGPVESWVNFVPNGEQFGLVRDGNWHRISIPLSRFMATANFNLNAVEQSFMVASVTAPTTGAELFFDNIFLSPGPLGLKEDKEFSAGVTLYPNPTQADLTLAGSQPLEGATVVVYDVLGKIAYTGKVTNGTVSVAALTPGVYQLVLTSKGKTAHKRFIKK